MSEWISVKDKLPENENVYYLIIDGNLMDVAQYWNKSGWFNGDIFIEPSHYMNLPEPPKD